MADLMAYQSKVGSFGLNTTAGNQAITGVGFQPKVVILLTMASVAEGFAQAEWIGWGWATGSANRFAMGMDSVDAAATSDCWRSAQNTKCITVPASAASAKYEADFVSMDADGFTINVTTAPKGASKVGYLALGGSDLTNAKAADFAAATVSGNQVVTGVGFKPDVVLFMWHRDTAFGQRTNVKNSLGGAWVDPVGGQITQLASFIAEQDGAGTSDVGQTQVSNRCIWGSTEASVSAIDGSASFISFDADGFTINWATGEVPGSAWKVGYLALKGGQYKLGIETQKTAVGVKDTYLGFKPSALVAWGANAVANASADATKERISLGVADDKGNEATIWGQAVDGLTDTQVAARFVTGKLLSHDTADSTIDAECDSILTKSSFGLDWTTANAIAREFFYLACGEVGPHPPVKVIDQAVNRAAVI